ncbi:MAG: hypothetical protein ABIK53_02735 [bacterium]
MKKPKIGLIGLTAELYQAKAPDLVNDLSKFSNELNKVMGKSAKVIHIPLVYTRAQMENACTKLKKEKVNGIILVFLSYSPSLIIAPVLKKYQDIPILLWNTQKLYTIDQKFKVYDTSLNHGMHGVQDTASVLLRENIRFSLITGHYQNKCVLEKIDKWCEAASLINLLRKARIARIGGRFKDMGDFAVSDEKITKILGPEILDVSVDKIAEESSKIKRNEIEKKMKSDGRDFKIDKSLDKKTHFISARLELALRRIIQKEKLDGLGINFMAFKGDKGAETIPFMAIAKFMAEGMGYGGEGDVLCATSVLIMQKLCGMAGFVEMFTTDYKNNRIFFEHMGESNPLMARNKASIRLIKKDMPLSGKGLSTAMFLFPLKPGKVTLLNIALDKEGKFKFIVNCGEVIKMNLFKDIDAPHFILKIEGDVRDFLTRYSLQGGTHHLAMAYGDKTEEIKFLSEIMDIPVFEI